MTPKNDFNSFVEESLQRIRKEAAILTPYTGKENIYYAICAYPDIYKFFLNELFNASLHVEEGRQVRLRVAFCYNSFKPEIIFEKEIEFEAKRIVKMAPIINLWDRLLAINLDNNGQLKISGIVQPKQIDWNYIHNRNGCNKYTLQFLSIEVHRPGEIRIDYPLFSQFNKGDQGKFSKLIEIKSLANWYKQIGYQFEKLKPIDLQRFKNGEKIDTVDGYDTIQFFTHCLTNILKYMREGKHGGCITIVSDDVNLKSQLELNDYKIETDYLRHSLEQRFKLNEIKDALSFIDVETAPLLTAPFTTMTKEEIAISVDKLHFSEKALCSAEQFIASLTYVDGAVVLTQDLKIIGFGARFLSKLDDPKKQLKNVGMRHRSAYDFCCNVKDSIAIVVSQDGGITVFANNGENTCTHEKIILDYERTDL